MRQLALTIALCQRLLLAAALIHFLPGRALADDLFGQGIAEYEAGHYVQAADNFGMATTKAPSVAAYYNLGNAEWQAGRPGPAVLAWEQAHWLDPYSRDAAANLRFARRVRQLESPELGWCEICSTWLPVNAWPWAACLSFWLAVSMVLLPGIFGWRRAGWQQGVAAASFAIFLLTIPALAGIQSRTHLGIILPAEAPLRLTPTAEAQILSRLPSGTAARVERKRGKYIFVRSGSSFGWLNPDELGLIAR